MSAMMVGSAKTIDQLVDNAFDHFDEFKDGYGVVPKSSPILFFGNLADYQQSQRKIVTVGLNPSNAEFTDERFNFPYAPRQDKEKYIKSLSDYFVFNPLVWFDPYNKFLRYFDASFYPGKSNIALHTDLLSPLATNPTWSKLKLGKDKRDRLVKSGFKIWSELMNFLQPDIIICSIGKNHIEHRHAFGPSALEPFGPQFSYGECNASCKHSCTKHFHRVSRVKSDNFNIFHLLAKNHPVNMQEKQYPELVELIISTVNDDPNHIPPS